jgi:hypothetical protein
MVGLPPSLAMTTPPRDFLRGGVRAQVCQKEIEMNAQFSLIKILVVAFASTTACFKIKHLAV